MIQTGDEAMIANVEEMQRTGVPLRVLVVEDSEDDAELVLWALRRGGYAPMSRRVETAVEMAEALRRGSWDVVIADYAMPHFGALSALWVLREFGSDLPCLIVSGAISDEMAVSCMKAGASRERLSFSR
jgi:phosphoserine phosphatase RsbU/P